VSSACLTSWAAAISAAAAANCLWLLLLLSPVVAAPAAAAAGPVPLLPLLPQPHPYCVGHLSPPGSSISRQHKQINSSNYGSSSILLKKPN